MTRPERPTPPALSRGQLARLPTSELLARVDMLRNVDPLTVELATRLRDYAVTDADFAALDAGLAARERDRGAAAA